MTQTVMEAARAAYDAQTTGRVAYYGTKINPHQVKTGEGFVIYLDVPIARTGPQEYTARELGEEGSEPVQVWREPEEVFSPATIASFEGKVVTDNHPERMVDQENVLVLLKGIVTHVRRGSGAESDLLLADLVVYDPWLNQQIQAGKREISSGYYHDLVEEDGRLYQRNIRGNHVAVVEAGRAGPRVAIKDQQMIQERRKTMEKSKKKSFVGRLFSVAAKDADPEELAEIVAEHLEAAVPQEGGDPASQDPPPAKDEGAGLEAVLAVLKSIQERLDRLEAGKPSPEDQLDALEAELEGKEEQDPAADEEAVVMDEEGEGCQISRDTAAALLHAIRPSLEKIQDPTARRAAKDQLAGSLRKMIQRDAGVAALARVNAAQQRAAKDAEARKAAEEDPAAIGRRIRDTYNPHYTHKK